MSRLFRPDTANTVLLPVDHGILGKVRGLEDPIEVLSRLIPLGLDGVLRITAFGFNQNLCFMVERLQRGFYPRIRFTEMGLGLSIMI
jgi:hypothetical protein